jgi:hypothetical protein
VEKFVIEHLVWEKNVVSLEKYFIRINIVIHLAVNMTLCQYHLMIGDIEGKTKIELKETKKSIIQLKKQYIL